MTSAGSITRRQGLGFIAGGATMLAHPISSMAATHSPSLSDLAAAKGIRFGSAVAGQGGGSWRNPALADLLKRECSILVAENEMKWQAIRPSPTAFDFAAFDDIARFAGQTKMALRGHTLLWHRSKWMPRWLEKHDFGPQPATAAARLMANHVETVCARYNGKITSFDVVNETVLPEDGILAQTALSKAMGSTEALVDLAFHTARMAAPGVELVYNDYMSWEPGNALHRMGVLRLLEGFRKRGTPVDALGIQSHLIAPVPDAAYQREWRRFVDEVVAMDYRLVITEFDVRDRDLPVDIPSRDRTVADTAKAYFETMLDYPQLRDVLAWGMVDAYSWLQGYEPRADKAEARGCLYDSHFRPKPVYAALAQAFVEARPRT